MDRELGFAKALGVTSLRVFVTMSAWQGDHKPAVFMANYAAFQRLLAEHDLTLLATFYAMSQTV